MSNDIVARLRDIDGGYGFRAICKEAADEIERLRDDRETMLSLLGTIADIRDAAGVGDRVMLGELAERIKHLRAERDEARREVCVAEAMLSPLGATTPRMEAAERGWDCFKEAKP